MIPIKESWKAAGYVDEPVPRDLDLHAEIRRLCREKNAVVMAHYYTAAAVQQVADFVGDSLALAQRAARTGADIIVMCGVHFMGETNKLLCPGKRVLLPDLGATCSLAESCPADAFARFVKAHPDHKVISYVNTSAATKAVTDVVVTSGNARQIVESFPRSRSSFSVPTAISAPTSTASPAATCSCGTGPATCTSASRWKSSWLSCASIPAPRCWCTPSAAAPW